LLLWHYRHAAAETSLEKHFHAGKHNQSDAIDWPGAPGGVNDPPDWPSAGLAAITTRTTPAAVEMSFFVFIVRPFMFEASV